MALLVRTIEILYDDEHSRSMADGLSDSLTALVGDGIIDWMPIGDDRPIEDADARDRFPDGFIGGKTGEKNDEEEIACTYCGSTNTFLMEVDTWADKYWCQDCTDSFMHEEKKDED